MDNILKNNIIDTMKAIHEKIGETVLIEDWISTGGNKYDRHQTRYGRFIIKIVDFGIRTSGAIASIRGEDQLLEFRSDSIRLIEKTEGIIKMDINMAGNVWRRIKISQPDPIKTQR